MQKTINVLLVMFLSILSIPMSHIHAEEGMNLLPNGDFTEMENEKNGFWLEDKKPKFWFLEKYSGSNAPDENFKASLDDGVITIESLSKWQSPLTFFKPTSRINVKPGHRYELSFDYKAKFEDKIDNKVPLEIAFDAYTDGYRQNDLSKSYPLEESNDWKSISKELTVNGEFNEILPVFKMNFVKGTYSIKNLKLIETKLEIELETLNFNQDEIKIASGSELNLPLDIQPLEYPLNNLTWESSNPEVASVNEQGQVMTHQVGQTIVTVRDTKSSLESSISITVIEIETENMLKNPSFEIKQKAPLKENTPENRWHQDVGFWKNDLKASDWIFERYQNSTSPRDNFMAEIDSEEAYSGSNSVKVTQETNWGNSLSFFKPQSRISVEPNTEYILEAYYKMEDWRPTDANRGLFMQVDAYRGNSFDSQIGRVLLEENSDWTKASLNFKTGDEHTLILPVFRMEHTAGSYWLDDVRLYPKPITADKIEFLEKDINIKTGQEVFLQYRSEPEKIDIETLEWSVENEDITSLNQGSILGLKPGTTTVELCSIFDQNVCDSVKVTVEDNISITNFSFEQEQLDMNIDKKIFIQGHLKPKYAEIEDIDFISKDENIIKIENTLIVPQKTGTTLIEARYDGKVMDTLSVTVHENEYPKIQNILDTWEAQLTTSKIENDLSKQFREQMIIQGEELYAEMLKSQSFRTSLWPETKTTHSANMTDQFRKLRDVTMAFSLAESSLYEDRQVYFEIRSAIDFLYKTYGYDGNAKVFKGNWWDYQIGSTKALSDILVLLDRYTDEETMYNVSETPSNYVPNAVDQMSKEGDVSTGANRTDIGIGVLATASLQRKEEKLEQLKKDMMPVFDLVETGDGLYTDGSMIQHEFIPYTGGYGAVYLDGVATILSRLQGSPWEIPLSDYEHLYDVLEKGFIPLIYKGRLMAMVQGRGMSRSPKKMKTASALGGGYALTMNLLTIADLGPEDFKNKIYQLANIWISEQSKEINILDHLSSLSSVDIMSQALAQSSDGIEGLNGLYLYPGMDRVAYHHDDFGLGISMYSNRVANFESFSGENKNGWYTGDGMVYLYTDDTRQFGTSYWPTVNPYRLPGVTLDTRPLQVSSGERLTSKEDFVGGAGNDRFASVAFALNKDGFNNQNLKANKSYFILDNKIIFMGSEINGQSNYDINTIVDNRIFDQSIGDRIYVDGINVALSDEIVAKKWVSVESEVYNTKVTYLTLNNEIIVGRESRQGSYEDINELFGDNDKHEHDYVYMELKHGKDAQNEKYAYMAILNQDEEEIESIYHESPIQIISDNESVHAVYDSTNKILAVNVFKDKAKVDLSNINGLINGIDLSHGSYVFEFKDDKIISYVSDPTQKQDEIAFTFMNSDQIEFLETDEVKISLAKKNGQTIETMHEFKLLDKPELPQTEEKEDDSLEIDQEGPLDNGSQENMDDNPLTDVPSENINDSEKKDETLGSKSDIDVLPSTGQGTIGIVSMILIMIGLFIVLKERKKEA